MDAIRLLIVDDEPLARLRLRTLLGELDAGGTGDAATAPAVQIVAEAADADAATAALATPGIDAVLLDIGLPGRDGLRLAEALKALPQPPAVVFVTAHAEHALDAFELDAVDYLTKPVRRDRLAEALRRVRERRRAPAPAVLADAGPVLVVTERGRLLRLPHAEVLYVRAEHKMLVLRTAAASYLLDGSLYDLEQRLGAGFIRVHRNALVATAAVRALELREGLTADPADDGWAVRVAPVDEWIAVSRRQVAAVKAALEAQAGAAR